MTEVLVKGVQFDNRWRQRKEMTKIKSRIKTDRIPGCIVYMSG